MNRQEAQELITRYNRGEASPDEQKLVANWFLQQSRQQPLDGQELQFGHLKEEIWRNTLRKAGLVSRTTLLHMRWMAAAAIFIAVLATGLYFFLERIPASETGRIAATADIAPGYNQATLTLADGTQINLDSAKTGIQVGDKRILYNDGTAIGANEVPRAPGTYHVERTTYNSLSTPRGGQYQVILSDGTKVWLNAASTLKYPSKFTGDRREVELEGEAYFLAAKSEKPKAESQELPGPFVVNSKGQSVTVLGTEFNISAYEDEVSVKTTLVTGAVKVLGKQRAYSLQLEPGEQSIIDATGRITKQKVEPNGVVAWKNGLFSFNDAKLPDVMRQLSRWYNVDIIYGDPLPNISLRGELQRETSFSAVLLYLEKIGVSCKLQNGKLYVLSK